MRPHDEAGAREHPSRRPFTRTCGAPSRRLSLSCMDSMIAKNVSHDNRDAAKDGHRRCGLAEAALDPAVERESRIDHVDRAGIDRQDVSAAGLLAREPEGLHVWSNWPGYLRAGRQRDEVLCKPRQPAASADEADAVIEV